MADDAPPSAGSSGGGDEVKKEDDRADSKAAEPEPEPELENLFDLLFEEEIKHVPTRLRGMNMDAMLQAGMKAAMGDSTELAVLQSMGVSRSTERHRKLLDKIWHRYDANRNGILSVKENRVLTRDYLKSCHTWAPRVVETSLAAGMQVGLRMAASMSGKALAPEVLSEINVHVTSLHPQIVQVAKQVLAGIDVPTVADRALEAMDANLDGKVTKEEFVAEFLGVMTQMFDPSLIIAKIQQAMGMETP